MDIVLTLRGVDDVAMLTHNERLANSMDPIARAMKEISSKRIKTEDDHNELARLEFEGGLYLTSSGQVGVPSWNVKRSIQDGGKQNRLGKSIERGLAILSPDVVPITHAGPTDPQKMWESGHFDQRSVKVATSKVTRTRPRFMNWEVTVEFDLDEEILDVAQLELACDRGGKVAGLGDYRPRFGRYNAEIDLR